MSNGLHAERVLTSDRARLLSSSTKSAPIWSPRTPRWILEFLRERAIVKVEGGAFQLNQVLDESTIGRIREKPTRHVPSDSLRASYAHKEGALVEDSLAVYNDSPRVIALETVQSIVRLSNRVPALFSNDHDQIQAQLDVATEFIAETVENLVFNHEDFGLLHNVDDRMGFDASGPPTPDVLDDLLSLAWRRPDVFAMNPEALGEFRKQANARSLTLEQVHMLGGTFTSWRGVPILPTNKLQLLSRGLTGGAGGSAAAGRGTTGRREPTASTSVLLIRAGLDKQGVVCLCPNGVEHYDRIPHVSVDFMGMADNAVARYMLTTYVAVAVLSSGALARADVLV